MQRFNKSDPGSTDFFWSLRRFDAFDWVFNLPNVSASNPAHMRIFFRASIAHRGLIGLTPYEGAIDYSMHGGLRGPVSTPSEFPSDPIWELPLLIPGAVSASNIVSRTQHYGEANFSAPHTITVPGWYRLEILGKSRTDAAPSGTNALAELQQEVNVLNLLWGWVED